MSQIEVFENNKNWVATARQKDGKLVAVMRGAPKTEFADKLYLYPEDWSPPHPATGGMRPYSGDEIREKFESGELTLVRGGVPK